ncbi:MAG: hypothetical protein CL489_06240 [Acidobacteria bacterium]|nr:hypothetical protein [Acidobacteriota bacterium]|tara:strand:- start:36628 stop:36975 length:348 start_codon:yes stop_codon:yes gene_type:complete
MPTLKIEMSEVARKKIQELAKDNGLSLRDLLVASVKGFEEDSLKQVARTVQTVLERWARDETPRWGNFQIPSEWWKEAFETQLGKDHKWYHLWFVFNLAGRWVNDLEEWCNEVLK